jgi:hypothetical protein
MFFVWLICVSLVLGGWAARREVRAAFEDWNLQLFGIRARIHHPGRLPFSDRSVASRSTQRLPTPPVATWPVPRVGDGQPPGLSATPRGDERPRG